MRIVLFLLSFTCLSTSSVLMAQGFCGQTAYLTYLENQNAGLKEAAENTFFAALRGSKIKTKREQDTIYQIKVVFHIVYNNPQQNIEDSLVYSQLKVMNDAFRRTNSDTINTRDTFKPFAADARIEFVLSTQDPDGNPSTGIIRKESRQSAFGSSPLDLSAADIVKTRNLGSAPWDTDQYLNIWICDLSFDGVDGLLGYAHPPTGAAFWDANSFEASDKQGVVCHYKVVGANNRFDLATGSKTLVHEVGHYLGLRHIWGDGGCAEDDFMDDTPRARRAGFGCNMGDNSCAEVVGKQFPDMVENYMDYSDDKCQNLFTHDQVAQMRSNLRMFRNSIYDEQIEPLPLPEIPDPMIAQTGVYPNPVVGDKLSVYIKNVDVNAKYDLILHNLIGQQVAVWNLESKSTQQIAGFLDLPGAYIYKIRQEGEQISIGKILVGK